MFKFGKRAQERRVLEKAKRNLLENALRTRLHSLVDFVAANVTKAHKLSLENVASIKEKAENIKSGVDLVLLKKIEWTDERIPGKFQGGATIANSAHAFFFMGVSSNDSKIFDLIGSERDAQTIGHICYSLGFSRDGMTLR
ncbi:MAG: hypothetical protein JWO15_421 [Sphingomonadales bacterium]|nr:hypothetical protein [Sphingomonadales bacterium]